MAIFNGHVITNAGRNLIGRAMAGEGRVIVTRAAMGDGKPSQDIRELTQLVSEKITANVADIFNDRGTINLKVQITNSQLEEAFKTEEFGIFAKIEGDEEEILYSYCNAVEADTIPSNSLGDIFVEEHTVYIAFSSNTEVDIYIKEGVVFLTLETANKNYIQTGLVVEGKLSNGRTSLKENGQYQADTGKWYHNIGGNRSWESGKGEADEQLIEISYFNLYKNIKKINDEVEKIASETELGRIKIGDYLQIDSEGKLSVSCTTPLEMENLVEKYKENTTFFRNNLKEMDIKWDLNNPAEFSPIFFMQGDWGIGNLNISILKEIEKGKIRATFVNENLIGEPYVIEEELNNNIAKIKIPNELFENFGKVSVRLTLRNFEDIILGNTENVYFYIVEKERWEKIEPFIPDSTQKYAQDVIDELYTALNSSKEDFDNYVNEMMKNNALTVEETLAIIKKYKNQEEE